MILGVAIGAGIATFLRAPRAATATVAAANAGGGRTKVGSTLLRAAREQLRAGDFREAEKLLDSCVQLTDSPECHRVLAIVLWLENDSAAAAHFDRAPAQDPR